MEEQRTELSVNLDRIINLYGVDEGFYVLSLFSWIECYICMKDPQIAFLTEKFSDKLRLFFEQMTPEQHSYSRLLFQLSGGHHLTNGVRHQFKELTKHEAISMTSEFINFCMFVDWSDPKLDTLRGSVLHGMISSILWKTTRDCIISGSRCSRPWRRTRN